MSELRKTLRAEAKQELEAKQAEILTTADNLCAGTSLDPDLLLRTVTGKRVATLTAKAITALANDAEADLLTLHTNKVRVHDDGKTPVKSFEGDRVNASSVTK